MSTLIGIGNFIYSNPVIAGGGEAIIQPDAIANLFAWYDADDLVGADGSTVSSWDNKEGTAGRDLVTVTSAPLLYNTPTGFSGHKAVLFDGIDDRIQVLSLSAESQPLHIFSIFRPVTWLAGRYLFDGGVAFEIALVGAAVEPRYDMYGGLQVSPCNAATGATHIGEFLFASPAGETNSTSIIDDAAASAGADAGANTLTGISLGRKASGGGGALNTYIAEHIVYTSEVTGSDLAGIRAYFAGKYGVNTN